MNCQAHLLISSPGQVRLDLKGTNIDLHRKSLILASNPVGSKDGVRFVVLPRGGLPYQRHRSWYALVSWHADKDMANES